MSQVGKAVTKLVNNRKLFSCEGVLEVQEHLGKIKKTKIPVQHRVTHIYVPSPENSFISG